MTFLFAKTDDGKSVKKGRATYKRRKNLQPWPKTPKYLDDKTYEPCLQFKSN